MRYFPSFKSFGDLVIACHHLRRLSSEDGILLCADHLRPLLNALGYSRQVKWLGDSQEGVPALFDIGKRGAYAAAKSAWVLRRAVRDVTYPEDILVFDRIGWRQRWISAGRATRQIASGEANIYQDYEKLLGLTQSVVRVDERERRLTRIGIFPDSRLAAKQIPESLVIQMANALKTMGFQVQVVRAGPQSEIHTFDGLLASLRNWDAVISADSLPAHLAEYEGRPVFVVTPQPNHYWLPKSAFVHGHTALFSASIEAVKAWAQSLVP
jgi:hypothetical protein